MRNSNILDERTGKPSSYNWDVDYALPGIRQNTGQSSTMPTVQGLHLILI